MCLRGAAAESRQRRAVITQHGRVRPETRLVLLLVSSQLSAIMADDQSLQRCALLTSQTLTSSCPKPPWPSLICLHNVPDFKTVWHHIAHVSDIKTYYSTNECTSCLWEAVNRAIDSAVAVEQWSRSYGGNYVNTIVNNSFKLIIVLFDLPVWWRQWLQTPPGLHTVTTFTTS